MSHQSPSFQSYPFLTPDEFSETCHHLDCRYRQAILGPLRRRWKLRVCTALNSAYTPNGPEYANFIQIVRPLEENVDLADGDLSTLLYRFTMQDVHCGRDVDLGQADQEMVDAEDGDESALSKKPQPESGIVTYEIHLHPTYQAPCLWFKLDGLPVGESAFDIDTVFRRLVPEHFKDGLRTRGLGGISIDHHPVTGVPSFFIHPCLLGEAMSEFDCSKENYLMTWLGLVGGPVGLWVPKEMAMDR